MYLWIAYSCATEGRKVSTIFSSKKFCYYRRKRSDVPTWWYRELNCDWFLISLDYFHSLYFYRTTREAKVFSPSSFLIGAFPVDMKCTMSRWNLWSNILEKLYNLLFWSIDKGSFRYVSKWWSEIIRLCVTIPSYSRQIPLVGSFKKRYQLSRVPCSNEDEPTGEGIKGSCVPHFFYPESFPEFSDDIKTRHSYRFIDKKKHSYSPSSG